MIDEFRTRLATSADAASMTAIYNEGIADRVATFETEPRTTEQVESPLTRRLVSQILWRIERLVGDPS